MLFIKDIDYKSSYLGVDVKESMLHSQVDGFYFGHHQKPYPANNGLVLDPTNWLVHWVSLPDSTKTIVFQLEVDENWQEKYHSYYALIYILKEKYPHFLLECNQPSLLQKLYYDFKQYHRNLNVVGNLDDHQGYEYLSTTFSTGSIDKIKQVLVDGKWVIVHTKGHSIQKNEGLKQLMEETKECDSRLMVCASRISQPKQLYKQYHTKNQ